MGNDISKNMMHEYQIPTNITSTRILHSCTKHN